jgi:5-methylcytosine-specific restriction endonuclease McrA
MKRTTDSSRSRDKIVFAKTDGHCHFCGDVLTFRNFGRSKRKRDWVIDHVIYRASGGPSTVDNYLPACSRCNGLRWNRPGYQVQGLLLLGVIAANEIRNHPKSQVAHDLIAIHRKRESWKSKWINEGCPRH